MTYREYCAMLRAAGWTHLDGGPGYYVHEDHGDLDLYAMRDWGDGIEERWRYLARHELLPGEGDE